MGNKTITELSCEELYQKARQAAQHYCAKYELSFSQPKTFNLHRQKNHRSMYETYYTLSGLLHHLRTYKTIYDPENCLCCRFDDAKHCKVLQHSLHRWKPLIQRTVDGAALLKNANA